MAEDVAYDGGITLTDDEIAHLELCRINPTPPTPMILKDIKSSTVTPSYVPQNALITVALSVHHKTDRFCCCKNPRVAGFFEREAKLLIPSNFCQAFVAFDPTYENSVLGYYTLSPASVRRESLTRSDENAPRMALIGFLGRDDTAPKGFGGVLLIDAARRVLRDGIGMYGLVLQSAGGKTNHKLWSWYLGRGFRECQRSDGVMYAPLSAFMPELLGL